MPVAYLDWTCEIAKRNMVSIETMLAAIAIFLFSEAGMLLLIQVRPDRSGQVEFSPYLVTLTALVSGFMSEAVFNRITMVSATCKAAIVLPLRSWRLRVWRN